jgi:hypothetical protein
MESSDSPKENDLRDLKSLLERVSGQVQMSTLVKKEDTVASPQVKADIRDIADEVRKGFFRKEDKTPQVVGTVMGVIAIVSSMTAILTPMNAERERLAKIVEKHIDEDRQGEKEAAHLTDRDLQRLEDRIKEAVGSIDARMGKIDERADMMANEIAKNHMRDFDKLSNQLDVLKAGEVEDKAVNMKVETMYQMLMRQQGSK